MGEDKNFDDMELEEWTSRCHYDYVSIYFIYQTYKKGKTLYTLYNLNGLKYLDDYFYYKGEVSMWLSFLGGKSRMERFYLGFDVRYFKPHIYLMKKGPLPFNKHCGLKWIL